MAVPVAAYAELHCYSNFTFLEGASHPEDLVARAAQLGYTALALTDRDGLYAAVRLSQAALEHGIQPLFGAEVTLEDGSHLTLLATDATGYHSLSLLLTAGRRARPKGESAVPWETLAGHTAGLIALSGPARGRVPTALRRKDPGQARQETGRLLDLFGAGNVYLEVTDHLLPAEATLRSRMLELARTMDVPLVATQQARYADPSGRRLQDVLTCVRHHTHLAAAGTRLLPNGDFYLHPIEDLAHRFRALPEALSNTVRIAERCRLSLADLRFELPGFPVPPPFGTALEYLEHLTFTHAPARFPEVDARVVAQLRHELQVIGRHGLEGYFLIVWDIMKFCHDRGILAQGRGSAANSAVCFALGITNVDPIKLELLFERFLSEGRNEAPDIDLDIANDRREEVIQYVYERYGRDHTGMVCEVISYRARSAVRDVGKALGLSLEQVDRLAKGLERSGGDGRPAAASRNDGPEAPLVTGEGPGERSLAREADGEKPVEGEDRRIELELWDLCRQIEGFPRHLGIHVGGMIISAAPLGSVVPIENAAMEGRTVIQWDKDDVGALKMAKIDLLGLGMLAAIGEALELIQVHERVTVDPARLTYDDPEVYDMLCEADTVGLFQVESRAQMNVLPQLKPRRFYDLVVQVALIRPGPIQGDMVHPYLRRRAGTEPVTYPHPDLKPVLERTLGVPLFQEQGMKVAVIAAGFTPSEADALRRAMGSKRSRGQMERLTGRLLEGMKRNGYSDELAQRIVSQIEAFASYGFPESHAASFALLVYLSGWLKRYHPLAFYTALLNNQPMGFYSPATLVAEARRRGIPVLPVDVTRSQWEWTIEAGQLRAGLKSVRGLGEARRLEWEEARRAGPWRSVDDVCRRTRWPRLCLERLAAVGAFSGLGVDRRTALWQVQGYRERPELAAPVALEPRAALKPVGRAEALVTDLHLVGHSVDTHPVELMRRTLERWNVVPSHRLNRVRAGTSTRVAGVVSVRQKPPTAKGFCFITLEDEHGMINVIVRPDKYTEYRPVVRRAVLLLIEGTLQRHSGVVNVLAEKIAALDDRWAAGMKSRDFH